MNTPVLRLMLPLGLVLLVGITGCGKKEEPKPPVQQPVQMPPPPQPAVASVVLAKGVDISWNAVNAATDFKPKDRINALVKTENAVPGNLLKVEWYYVNTNQLIKTDSVSLKETGTNNSSFFIERAKGWPAGSYRIDVSLNGAMARTAAFTVTQ